MTFDELKKNAVTGDIMLVSKSRATGVDGFVENAITDITAGPYYHVLTLYRDRETGALMVAEMLVGCGLRRCTIEERIADCDGTLSYGKFIELIRLQPEKTLTFLDKFAAEHHGYGVETLPLVAASDDLGLQVEPEKVRPVCSLLIEEEVDYVLDGQLHSLWSPNDCARYCQFIEPLTL